MQFGHAQAIVVEKVDMQSFFRIPRVLGYITRRHGTVGDAVYLVGSDQAVTPVAGAENPCDTNWHQVAEGKSAGKSRSHCSGGADSEAFGTVS